MFNQLQFKLTFILQLMWRNQAVHAMPWPEGLSGRQSEVLWRMSEEEAVKS